MPGEIKHEWSGTVLTITSDSGTSSSDLRGAKGDDGIRGPQGLPGECLHRHELTLTEEQKATGRKNINAYRAINEKGNLIEFEANAGLALSAFTTIEPTQAGTGEASPDNVRAISGFDKVALTVAGKNLLPLEESITFTQRTYIRLNNPIQPGVYTVSALITSNDTDNSGNWIGFEGGWYDGTNSYAKLKRGVRNSTTITLYNPVSVVFINAAETYSGSVGDTATATQVQIERGETATEYEPYKGTTTSVNLPSTVYGGSYDWKTGKLIITHKKQIINGTETWEYLTGGYPYFALRIGEYGYTKNGKYKCSHFANDDYLTSAYPAYNACCVLNSTSYKDSRLIIRPSLEIAADLTQWKSYLAAQAAAGTPVVVAYELETPETYYLTPYDFETIEGLNTIWSNTGETTITNLKGNAEALRNIMERVAALEDNIGG